MKIGIICCLLALMVVGCKEEAPTEIQWVHTKTIPLEGINPIGIAQGENGLWLSDGDHNRVVLVNMEGKLVRSIDSLDRPMHIASEKGDLLIPQYGNDEVVRFSESKKSMITTRDSLDAPAGIAVKGNQIAIADFYNNKIHFSENGQDWLTFGKEGNDDGDFYYPTDVQITEDKIWVADAYNNRLQVFDKKGNHLNTIGVAQKMNAATGIFITSDEVFSTDFENNRVLIFDLEGTFKQEIKDDILKPTDIMVIDGTLYVTNYKGKSLSLFEKKEVEVSIEEEHHDHHEDKGEHQDGEEDHHDGGEEHHDDEHEGHNDQKG